MADNYEINYDDERFTQVEEDKREALTNMEQTYSGMVSESDRYYDKQIQASKQWADDQSKLQQEQTDFAIEQIEQQKDQAHKDYIKEQSGSYQDWQKQSNQYGAEAEKMAAGGLQGTGYSESSQVSMYNTYQNRVASARQSYSQAVLNYNNAIKDARLQNNAKLAEIAYQALQQQLELSLQGFQYKNQLLLEQANKKMELENLYYNRYLDVLSQINTENALQEQIRQYNESLAEDKRQFDEQMAYTKSKSGGGGGGSSRSSWGEADGDDEGNDGPILKGSESASGIGKAIAGGIASLGMGPLSEQGLIDRINEGKVSVTQTEDGSYELKRNSNLGVAQALLDKFTWLK